ncbi:hypothetical protein [Hyphomonas sp.]|uniref:hypothetical protein n=1 Tax=Hyphomonas sp. TaxID=87 RepID=UPI0032EF8D2D
MNSVAVLLATVLFLGPGLGVYAGVFVMGGRKGFRPAPPSPGSVTTISFVVIGALISHSIASLLVLFAVEFGQVWSIASFAFEPNAYVLFFDLFDHHNALTDGEVAYLLFWLAALPLASCFIARVVTGLLLHQRSVSSFVYGWVEQLARESSPQNNWVVAFVLTTGKLGENIIGYEGIVRELTLDSSKQVTSILLEDVDRFLVAKQRGTFRRLTPHQETPKIGTLHLASDRIENIAFTIFSAEIQ